MPKQKTCQNTINKVLPQKRADDLWHMFVCACVCSIHTIFIMSEGYGWLENKTSIHSYHLMSPQKSVGQKYDKRMSFWHMLDRLLSRMEVWKYVPVTLGQGLLKVYPYFFVNFSISCHVCVHKQQKPVYGICYFSPVFHL